MAKWTVGKGIDKYIQDLQNLEFGSEEMAKRAVYEGAKIVTDAIRTSIQALTVGPPREGKVTQAQKAGLLEGLGIAGFRQDGTFINVKVGMDGYNSEKSRKYPNGQPNADSQIAGKRIIIRAETAFYRAFGEPDKGRGGKSDCRKTGR